MAAYALVGFPQATQQSFGENSWTPNVPVTKIPIPHVVDFMSFGFPS